MQNIKIYHIINAIKYKQDFIVQLKRFPEIINSKIEIKAIPDFILQGIFAVAGYHRPSVLE